MAHDQIVTRPTLAITMPMAELLTPRAPVVPTLNLSIKAAQRLLHSPLSSISLSAHPTATLSARSALVDELAPELADC